MASYERIRDRLPSLYRPEGADRRELLVALLLAISRATDNLDRATTAVLQSHWFAYADSALYDPYFLRSRQLAAATAPGVSPPASTHAFLPAPDDSALETFAYIHDLARLAALLPVLPWQVNTGQGETVEAYRQRIRRMIALYSNGLGTPDALRRVVEAELPVDMTLAPALRDRPFSVEEFPPVPRPQMTPVSEPDGQDGMVGPLMPWVLHNDGLLPAAPTLYLQGVAPQPGIADATDSPLIELYRQGLYFMPVTNVVDSGMGRTMAPGRMVRLGIAYRPTLATGLTLRLRPAYLSWLGGESGLLRAVSAPAGKAATADPTAPGPWQAEADGPAGIVHALCQTADLSLWACVEAGGAGALWRYDGQAWQNTASGPGPITCLAEDEPGQALLIGTGTGLQRMPLYPAAGTAFAAAPVVGSTVAVHALHQDHTGAWWAGTDDGLAQFGSDGSLAPAREGETVVLQGTPVFSIHEDEGGTLFFGSRLGLVQRRAPAGDWYWYAGNATNEEATDWLPWTPGPLPSAGQLFLPPVWAVLRGPDSSLWLGTEHGLARYVGYQVDGLAYATRMEAYPDLGDTPVYAISQDERGLVWFTTGRGLWRYDGRDLAQHRGDTWVPLGRADQFDPEDGSGPRDRGRWRWGRAAGQWQTSSGRTWATPLGIAPRTTAEPPLRCLVWTDTVLADLGAWDGTNFTHSGDVAQGDLCMRFKPDETSARDGGLPALPRLPLGYSIWRYLALEPDGDQPPAGPAWTHEGRYLPPKPPPDGASPPLTPEPGLFGPETNPVLANGLDRSVFAYLPAAKVWCAWQPRHPLSALVRLRKLAAQETLDPAVLDRVYAGMQRVRPAGVRVLLAVEEEIVRGVDHA